MTPTPMSDAEVKQWFRENRLAIYALHKSYKAIVGKEDNAIKSITFFAACLWFCLFDSSATVKPYTVFRIQKLLEGEK